MRLCTTKSDAYEFARTLTQEAVVEAAMSRGTSDTRDDVINVSIVEFRDGVPGEAQCLYDGEEWALADLPAKD
jgi:hypothetical protein